MRKIEWLRPPRLGQEPVDNSKIELKVAAQSI
jgi:hypothetical protein